MSTTQHEASIEVPRETPSVYDVSGTTYEQVREFVEATGVQAYFARAGDRVYLVVD